MDADKIVGRALDSIPTSDQFPIAQMVLDAGRIVSDFHSSKPSHSLVSQAEFDTPSKLLEKKDSLLQKLVHESTDKEALLSLAASAHDLQ
jgi:hypothetical protein